MSWWKRKEDVVKEPEYAVELPEIKVNITPEAHKKMFEYVHSIDGEISGMGLVRQDSDEEFTVYDVFILPQEAGSAYTALNPQAIAKKVYELHKAGKYKDLSVWWHSHSDMETFWSGTDTATCDRLANNKFLVSMVVNKKQEVRCRVDLYKPLRITVDDVMVKMPDVKVPASDRAKKEIVSVVTPVVFQYVSGGYYGGTLGKVEEDPYLFKGKRISRKRWAEEREPDFGYSTHDSEWEKAWRKWRYKEKRRPLLEAQLSSVIVEPGSYKTTHYSAKDRDYIDENYTPLLSEEAGYVMKQTKHTAVVSMSGGAVLRVPLNRLKVVIPDA